VSSTLVILLMCESLITSAESFLLFFLYSSPSYVGAETRSN
jgi:hypothetical protein